MPKHDQQMRSSPRHRGFDGPFDEPVGPGTEWWKLFNDSPRTCRNWVPVLFPASLAAVAGIVVLLWLVLWPADHATDTDRTSAATTTSPAPDIDDRIWQRLPSGFDPESCQPVAVPGVLAEVTCNQSSEVGGPVSATFSMVRDSAALNAAFGRTVRDLNVVVCPGDIQSPGPWHTATMPQRARGILVCGLRDNVPTLAWTNDDEQLLSIIRGHRQDLTLEQLLGWWTSLQ
jgi:serine/threonine kinase PknH